MSDRRIEDLGDSLAVPRKNGELVFEAPWEGRVFGMTVALSDGEVYPWNDFRDRLVAEITAAEEHGDDSGYYERWLASFERLLLDSGLVTAEELDTRTAEYAAAPIRGDTAPPEPVRGPVPCARNNSRSRRRITDRGGGRR